jgi:small acid-soluble spore protein L (minor)
MEGIIMSKKNHKNRGNTKSGVNPQGYAEDVLTENPKSELENIAKKKNTKI